MTQPVPKGKVYLAGAGPGDPGLLTLRAVAVLREADVLLHDNLASDATLAFAPPDCERIYVGKRPGAHAMTQSQINELMIEHARAGRSVVRLKGGDPFVFGRGGEEAQALAQAGIAFEIIPGISSAIAAPAYAGIPVTHRDHNIAFTVLTGHEDLEKTASTIDWSRFADTHQTLVLLMSIANLNAISQTLQAAGADAATPAAAIADGTRPTQRTVVATLGTIADAVRDAQLTPPAVVVIGSVVNVRQDIPWFDRGPLFGKRVLVTRPVHQAGDFAADLLTAGAQPVLAPCIELAPPDDESAQKLLQNASWYDWIVFTSANGVEAFFAQLRMLGKDSRHVGSAKVVAIGPKTAQKLCEYGIVADLVPQRYVAEELARALRDAAAPRDEILLFRAQEARDVLPAMLEEDGFVVFSATAYKTVLRDDPQIAQRAQSCDILTFTSASTVRGFAKNVGDAAQASRGKIVACIGPITAAAAREAGMQPDVVAQEYTYDGLVVALREALSSTGSASTH